MIFADFVTDLWMSSRSGATPRYLVNRDADQANVHI